METYFERKIYNKMLEWKREYTPEYALFLKGARRTGKTTLAERMGKEEYRSYITVSFDKASNQTKNLFLTIWKIWILFLIYYRSIIILNCIQGNP